MTLTYRDLFDAAQACAQQRTAVERKRAALAKRPGGRNWRAREEQLNQLDREAQRLLELGRALGAEAHETRDALRVPS